MSREIRIIVDDEVAAKLEKCAAARGLHDINGVRQVAADLLKRGLELPLTPEELMAMPPEERSALCVDQILRTPGLSLQELGVLKTS